MSDINIDVFSSGTTRIVDPANELIKAQDLRFSTGYPGGLFLDASFYVARDVVEYWEIQGAKRIMLRGAGEVVYEGDIDDLRSALSQKGQGIQVTATGYWGTVMMRRRWRKLWADARISNRIWRYSDLASATELCTIDRRDRLRFTPKAEQWTNNTYAAALYEMPINETISRVTYSYDFKEVAQAWEISVWRSTDAAAWTQMTDVSGETYNDGTTTVITADATDTIDVELATPSRYLEFRYYSRAAAQTPTSDGQYYGEFSNITVYSETGNIEATEIAKDIRAKLSGEGVLKASDTLIDSITYAAGLVPFIADNWDTMANILMRAVSFGDDSNNHWAVGIRDSGQALPWDGLPVLFLEQYPTLTDYDYVLQLGEQNIVSPLKLVKNYDNIWNWIIVSYRDAEGKRNYITPDDDSDLKDQDSIDDYGQRDYVLNLRNSTSADATNSGKRFLATYKDPQWVLKSPIKIKGYIRGSDGQRIPCIKIVAGKRILIENFVYPQVIFRISRTTYDDNKQQTTIGAGRADDLIYPRWVPPAIRGY